MMDQISTIIDRLFIRGWNTEYDAGAKQLKEKALLLFASKFGNPTSVHFRNTTSTAASTMTSSPTVSAAATVSATEGSWVISALAVLVILVASAAIIFILPQPERREGRRMRKEERSGSGPGTLMRRMEELVDASYEVEKDTKNTTLGVHDQRAQYIIQKAVGEFRGYKRELFIASNDKPDYFEFEFGEFKQDLQKLANLGEKTRADMCIQDLSLNSQRDLYAFKGLLRECGNYQKAHRDSELERTQARTDEMFANERSWETIRKEQTSAQEQQILTEDKDASSSPTTEVSRDALFEKVTELLQKIVGSKGDEKTNELHRIESELRASRRAMISKIHVEADEDNNGNDQKSDKYMSSTEIISSWSTNGKPPFLPRHENTYVPPHFRDLKPVSYMCEEVYGSDSEVSSQSVHDINVYKDKAGHRMLGSNEHTKEVWDQKLAAAKERVASLDEQRQTKKAEVEEEALQLRYEKDMQVEFREEFRTIEKAKEEQIRRSKLDNEPVKPLSEIIQDMEEEEAKSKDAHQIEISEVVVKVENVRSKVDPQELKSILEKERQEVSEEEELEEKEEDEDEILVLVEHHDEEYVVVDESDDGWDYHFD